MRGNFAFGWKLLTSVQRLPLFFWISSLNKDTGFAGLKYCYVIGDAVVGFLKLTGLFIECAGADLTPDSINKLCSRSRTDTVETRNDCASSAVDNPDDSTLPGNLKFAQETIDAGTWTHPAAPIGFFNGAWPYGYNVGWSGMGLLPSATSFCPPPRAPAMGSGTPVGMQMWSGPPGGVWTGMWAVGMPQPGMAMSAMPFGWNLQQSGWTMPWRPVAHMAVEAYMEESDDLFRKRDSPESPEETVVRDIKVARVEAAEKVAAQ